MNLTDIRAWVIKLSGRVDLGALDGSTDNGVNDLIAFGQRMLDRMQPTPGSKRRLVADLASGEYKVSIESARAVEEVWIADSSGNRWELEPKDLSWIRSQYATSWDQVDSGPPLYYAANVQTLAPTQQGFLSDALTGMEDVGGVVFGADEGVRGLIVAPPSDGWHTVTVFGRFYERQLGSSIAAVGDLTLSGLPVADETFAIDSTTFTWKAAAGGDTEITIASTAQACIDNAVTVVNAKLSTCVVARVRDDILRVTWGTLGTAGNAITFTEAMTNASANGSGTLGGTQLGAEIVENWWSAEEPFALIYAALWAIETGYRNTEGAKDWMNSLMDVLTGVDKDNAFESANAEVQMRG